MSEDVERVERYLRGVVVPHYVSEPHRQRLRRRVLGEIGNRQAVCLRNKSWKIAAAVVVVGLGGMVGTFVKMMYRPTDESSANASGTAGAPQVAQDFQEIDLLRQQGNIELVQVIESEVNGRTLVQRCILPDGRTKTIREGDPNGRGQDSPTSLTTAAWTEIGQLRQSGKGETLGLQEKQVKGRPFIFTRERYTLRNGTKVILSVGEPKADQPAPASAVGGSSKERK